MTMAARGPKTEILQFDWLISGLIFPASPAQGGKERHAYDEWKLQFLSKYEVEV